MSLALAIAHAIGSATANRLANRSPSVAINRGTQERYIQPLFVHDSRKSTREAAE